MGLPRKKIRQMYRHNEMSDGAGAIVEIYGFANKDGVLIRNEIKYCDSSFLLLSC